MTPYTMSHVRLLVDDFPTAFSFYTDRIGLTPVWGDRGSLYADLATGGDVQLALFARSEMPSVGVRGTGDPSLLVFRVPEVDVALKRLRGQGVHVHAEARDEPHWGIRVAHVRDPEGNLIELNSPLPEDAWSDHLRKQTQRFVEDGA